VLDVLHHAWTNEGDFHLEVCDLMNKVRKRIENLRSVIKDSMEEAVQKRKETYDRGTK